MIESLSFKFHLLHLSICIYILPSSIKCIRIEKKNLKPRLRIAAHFITSQRYNIFFIKINRIIVLFNL